jgi:ssDNA-binding Zn-finger/Zn-ribbon topoisomerase 1
MFGVPITLLQNHLYGITQSKIKKQGQNVAKKGKGICAICETMKVIKHSITHTIKTKSCQDYTCERQTPSKNGIPRGGWFKWFKEHNPNLLVKVAHGLEVGHMKGLCPTNVESFYTNLTQE